MENKMTTPRVYTVSLDNPDYIDTGKIAFRPTKERPTNVPMFIQAEVILLSDHKEVVEAEIRKEHDRLEKIYCADTDRLEALNKRQALAIERLKEHKRGWVRINDKNEYVVRQQLDFEDAEITAILQEAK